MRNFALLSLLGLFLTAGVATAQEEPVLCAAVVPCDEQGEVLAQFREGACGSLYADVCKSERINRLEGELSSCSQITQESQKSIKKLQADLRKTKRSLREARENNG